MHTLRCQTPFWIFCKAFDILLCTLMQYMHIIHKVFLFIHWRNASQAAFEFSVQCKWPSMAYEAVSGIVFKHILTSNRAAVRENPPYVHTSCTLLFFSFFSLFKIMYFLFPFLDSKLPLGTRVSNLTTSQVACACEPDATLNRTNDLTLRLLIKVGVARVSHLPDHTARNKKPRGGICVKSCGAARKRGGQRQKDNQRVTT